MFTSRAEYRLQLREDNADLRLTEIGRKLGIVDDVRWQAFEEKRESIAREEQRLRGTWVNPRILPEEEALRVLGRNIEREYSLYELLRRPDVTYASLMTLTGAGVQAEESVAQQIEIQAKYQGYIEKQQVEIEQQEHFEGLLLPAEFDYCSVRGLSKEAQQKLNQHKPQTIGQASRISGITPATISLLLVHLKRGFKGDQPEQKCA
jgi:tRNA uridine 5-carboxymethylaminomethyl modification enzyme